MNAVNAVNQAINFLDQHRSEGELKENK
jgi:hypothetical protein